jgi:[pyruvate, water dikinase]-phosphate phosphotransferase / [pyruvate, water dikinase] kinase
VNATPWSKPGRKSTPPISEETVWPEPRVHETIETVKSAAPPPKTPSVSDHRIIIVSDGTGETAAQMTKAAMVQFSNRNIYFTRYKNVRNEAQIEAICDDAGTHGDLLVYTIVSPQLRSFLISRAREKNIQSVDLLGPLLVGLASHFGYEPKSIAGLLHDVNEAYFKRIEAMEYTIQHDDGRDLTGLDKADVVILGISRTSKTPLSMYLSHQGWRVANIPLIQGFEVPSEIFAIEQRRVIGLTIDPEDLAVIRRARLERLGQDRGGEYADPDKVNQEIDYANELFRRNRKWPVFNVTGKALEETASEIIKLMASRRLLPPQPMENLPPVPEGGKPSTK